MMGTLHRPDGEERLAVFDGLTVGDETLDDLTGRVGLDLVHQLHGLDDADDLTLRDAVADSRYSVSLWWLFGIEIQDLRVSTQLWARAIKSCGYQILGKTRDSHSR